MPNSEEKTSCSILIWPKFHFDDKLEHYFTELKNNWNTGKNNRCFGPFEHITGTTLCRIGASWWMERSYFIYFSFNSPFLFWLLYIFLM